MKVVVSAFHAGLRRPRTTWSTTAAANIVFAGFGATTKVASHCLRQMSLHKNAVCVPTCPYGAHRIALWSSWTAGCAASTLMLPLTSANGARFSGTRAICQVTKEMLNLLRSCRGAHVLTWGVSEWYMRAVGASPSVEPRASSARPVGCRLRNACVELAVKCQRKPKSSTIDVARLATTRGTHTRKKRLWRKRVVST